MVERAGIARMWRRMRESEIELKMDHYAAGLAMTALDALSRKSFHEYMVNVTHLDGEMPEKEKTRFTRFGEMAGLVVSFGSSPMGEYGGYTTVKFVLKAD